MTGILRKVFDFLAPKAKQAEDGRDMFGSRLTFILCAMGGAVGLGNLLRFPSIAYNNYGAQFFVPYLIALVFIAFPVLVLEISIGSAYRSGCVVAWNHINRRTRGVGLAVVFNGYSVVTYYIPLLAWVMKYFRLSFHSPLPWSNLGPDDDFFMDEIVQYVGPVGGSLNPDGSVAEYSTWPGTSLVGETVGWAFFTWFVTWLCLFRGVGLTGRVIYITMALPLIMIIILVGRSASLPNAGRGIKLYFGTWRSEALSDPQIWNDAFGQIFFSIGVGFGYFTSWASYCSQHSNTVQDALIIALSNSAVEIIGAFAVFGVVGFLGMHPETSGRLSTFVSGFYTYPEALAQMPASNFFSVLFFFTLFLLGLTSAFSLLETMTTLILDTTWGSRIPRWVVATVVAIISFLISLIYCTEFGLQALDAVDTYVNGVALFSVVWCEAFCATTLYRYKDAVSQVGWIGFLTFNVGLVLAQALGIGIAYPTQAAIGAGVGFGIFIIAVVASVMLSKTPSIAAPGFFGRNVFLNRIWWCGFYSGYQLTRDLNAVVGVGKNWGIPFVWAPCLKFISGPILAIVLSFSYSGFPAKMYDPVWTYGFSIMHLVFPIMIAGFLVPSWFDLIVPEDKRDKGVHPVAPLEVLEPTDGEPLPLNAVSFEDGMNAKEQKGMNEAHHRDMA
ncbi:Sodium and chloride-dependent GABA transporter 2 [Colletotrichum truncatum]|uniref:Sodium and chloride-dependent GABA transporter 2 n=1 Tax=Colletotrichum truncatum TaxID=5467 RepID=A0ACC3Z8Q7_COLTU|nr:Sodium and chloride-dependent GABA transporter 2 [Colletotrichum truncatum]KAF6789289.1 Sodium and chloride-dependent GABA transporter 2 [Colletotrichum truncatum]